MALLPSTTSISGSAYGLIALVDVPAGETSGALELEALGTLPAGYTLEDGALVYDGTGVGFTTSGSLLLATDPGEDPPTTGAAVAQQADSTGTGGWTDSLAVTFQPDQRHAGAGITGMAVTAGTVAFRVRNDTDQAVAGYLVIALEVLL